jgi:hypothetical protein
MFETLISYIEKTDSVSTLRPGLIAGKDKLVLKVAEIKAKAAKQSTQTGGITTDKGKAKGNLAEAMFINTTGTSAYAASKGDNTLKEKVNYSISDLKKLSDDMIIDVAVNLDEIINKVLDAELAGFGVDSDTLKDMMDAKDLFANAKNKPREAIVERSTQTEALVPLFKEGDDLIHDVMDPVALTLKKDHADWYIEYHNSGKIINTGTRHTTTEGDVLVQGTQAPIYNALVTLTSIDNPEVKIHTHVNGHWKVIPIKHGVWSLQVTHADYDEMHIAAFEIKQGENVIKNITMVPKTV